jgi:hypothetical protein
MLSRADLVAQALATWSEYALDGDTWSDADLGSDGSILFALGRGDVHAEDFVQPYAAASWNDHQVRAAIRALAAEEDRVRKPWSFTAEPKPRRARGKRRRYAAAVEKLDVVEMPEPEDAEPRLLLMPWPIAEVVGPPSPAELSAIPVLTDVAPQGVPLYSYDTNAMTVAGDHPALVSARSLATRALLHLTAMALRAYRPEQLAWGHISPALLADADTGSIVRMALDPKAVEAWVLRTLLPDREVVAAGLASGARVLDAPVAQVEILPIADLTGATVAYSPIMSVVGNVLRGVPTP